jgi:hypothetical protein
MSLFSSFGPQHMGRAANFATRPAYHKIMITVTNRLASQADEFPAILANYGGIMLK